MRELKNKYYGPPRHFESEDGNVTATVYRPVLEPEERRIREERLKRVVGNIMRPVVFPEIYGRKGKEDE
ncbi:MAG: hypothetical protein IJ733_19370 [Lachnospiraceae bacterium]|nr:hypothetical protein [Lachnospiraceae bacterium]